MRVRLLRASPWVSISGVVALLVGLGWDAVLHRLDPTLAEREGIFTLTNPGHLLFAGGITLCVLGVLLFLLERMLARPAVSPGRRLVLLAPAAGLLALAGISLAFASSSPGGLSGHTHTHAADAGIAHVHSSSDKSVAGAPALNATLASVDAAPHNHAAASAGSGTDAATTSVVNGVVHQHGTEVPITAAQLSAAMKLWTDTKDGTTRLQDITVAQAEGYRPITPFVGGLAHFHNQAYFKAANTLDPAKPEELIYLRTPRGEIKLVGAMFLAQPGQPGPRVGGPLTAWHAHDNLCYSSAAVVVALTDSNGKCPAGTFFNGVTPEMLHVWLVDNPGGIFSEDMSPAAVVALMSGK